jgi:hypothetical protein
MAACHGEVRPAAIASARDAAPTRDQTCPRTIPPKPGLRVPADHGATPSAGVWYGTPELWTALQDGPDPAPTKSVWWSARFPGGDTEQHPDISVIAERLDAPAPPVRSAGPGTNARTPQDGWFMIADVPILPAGCWRVTARYKGAALSYVTLVR